jgi:hypothetical protein
LSYKIGELKIRELRARAETELGSAFDIRRFHDMVVGNGSLPIDVLEDMVTDWLSHRAGNKRPRSIRSVPNDRWREKRTARHSARPSAFADSIPSTVPLALPVKQVCRTLVAELENLQ